MADGQFLRIRRLQALAVVRLKFSQKLRGVVVIVGSAGGLGEQLLPVEAPLLVNREEVNQVARKAAGGESRNLGEHQVGEADDREAGNVLAGLVFLAMTKIGPGDFDADGLPSPSAFVPRSFKIDTNDHIYVLDIFSGRVLVLDPDGKYQRQIQFPQEYGFFSDLSVDSKGNILLIDSVKAMVFSAGKDANSFSALTQSLREYLNFPSSLTTDNRGTVYIVDENGSGIVILGKDGTFVGRQLSMGWTEGLLYYPSQMCINEKGDVFIADRGNSRVQIFGLVR